MECDIVAKQGIIIRMAENTEDLRAEPDFAVLLMSVNHKDMQGWSIKFLTGCN